MLCRVSLNMKNEKCKYCHEPLAYELVDNCMFANITADNMIGHEIELCCIECLIKIILLIA